MNFFKTFFRNVRNNKIVFSLNIFSLAVGFTISFIIFLWINGEISFDKYNAKLEDIYLVQIEEPGQKNSLQTPIPLGPALLEEHSEIEYYSSYFPDNQTLETNKLRAMVAGAEVDTSFFYIFDFHLINGNLKSAFETPNSILISQSVASRFFHGNPIGETIKLKNEKDFVVSGIVADIPRSSSISFDYLVFRDRKKEGQWGIWFPALFVKLKSNTNIAEFSEKLRIFPLLYEKEKAELSLYPFKDIHFNLDDRVFFTQYTEWTYIQAMFIVAMLILVLTCLNYINMSIILFSHRSKEIGLKKVFGAKKSDLSWQFIFELLFQGAMALVIGLGILVLAKYSLGDLVNNDIFNEVNAISLLVFVLMGLVVFFISSVYPAFVLSSFSPIKIFRDFKSSSTNGNFIRKALLIAQFAITSFVLFCTLVLNMQMNFVKEKDLGYVADNLIAVPMHGEELNAKYQTIWRELGKNENILDISRGSLRHIYFEDKILDWDKNDQIADREFLRFYPATASHGFDRTASLKVKQGRFFDEQFNDSLNAVVNEETVRQLGLKDPIGSKIKTRYKNLTIIGVVEDFNYGSVADKVQPVVFYNSEEGDMFLKIRPATGKAVLNHLAKVFKETVPGHLVEYQYMTDHIAGMYKDERKLENILIALSVICVFISLLGLFSFSSIIVQERNKTIAIKKILGASVPKLIIGLISSFVIYSIISYAIAVPFGYNIMKAWLDNYAYHPDLSIVVFAKTMLLIIIVVIVAVFMNVLKVSLRKPVEVLSRP